MNADQIIREVADKNGCKSLPHPRMISISRRHAREYAALAGIRIQTLRYSQEPIAIAARDALYRVLSGLAIPPGAMCLGIEPDYQPKGRPRAAIAHGTHAGYNRCHEMGGRPCEACRAGEAAYSADLRRLRRRLRYERDMASWLTGLRKAVG